MAIDVPARVPWNLDESYKGDYPDTAEKLRWEVPILMRQTLIDLSVKLGLSYEEGWRYPLTVQFVDGAPGGMENALAFVALAKTEKGIAQSLNINVWAYQKENFDFDKVLAHELVHAMLNDALGAEAALLLPVWLHEGLAVYGAGQGEKMLKNYVYRTSGWSEAKILNGLEGPHGALDYAEDYLAIKYIYEKHGQNSLHNFVRGVVGHRGDIPPAIESSCFETWDDFQKHVRAYSKEEIKRIGPAKRGYNEKPY
ncbi:MAG: hypothetical protein LHV69_03815 [Elusimicrobia bacterium]|nr:hypothetical protein [Candidatus Obscuribacterium magneticum]